MKQLFPLFILLLALKPLCAEIAPEEYRGMQLRSPEQIEIEVLSVSKSYNIFTSNTQVKVKAEVISVLISESNLSIGDRITIVYMHEKKKSNWAGPRSIPILRNKSQTDAFLAFDAENHFYVPAARGASFDPLIREF